MGFGNEDWVELDSLNSMPHDWIDSAALHHCFISGEYLHLKGSSQWSLMAEGRSDCVRQTTSTLLGA